MAVSLIELKLGQSQHEMAQRSRAVVGHILRRPVHGHGLPARDLDVVEQALSRAGGNVPLQKEIHEEVNNVGIRILARLAHKSGGIGAPAEASILSRSERER